MSEPREIWIDRNDFQEAQEGLQKGNFRQVAMALEPSREELIHNCIIGYVEKSAYDKLKADNEALKKYAEGLKLGANKLSESREALREALRNVGKHNGAHHRYARIASNALEADDERMKKA